MLTTTHAQSLALKAKLFRGFSDPSRLSILEALREEARSVSEIVEITGLPMGTVKSSLHRARKELAEHLENLGWSTNTR